MASPFSEWTIDDAKIAVQLSQELGEQLIEYRDFVSGNHFRDWAGWIGPVPDPSDEDYTTVRAAIQTGFVSRNAVGECVGRHVNGCLGRDVKWSLVPRRALEEGEQATTDEQALIKEAESLLKEWVTARKLNQEYDKVGATLLVAGAAYQRPFVPPGELTPQGTIPQADLATNMGRVYVHFPQPGEAVVYTDPRTQAKCSVYLYREQVGSRPSEAKGKEGDERAELTYLDEGQTIVRIVGKDGDIGAGGFTFPLANRLLMADMSRKPLLNPQVVSQQKLLNLALTMKQRNVILAGFLERVAINAQMNGAFDTVDGKRIFVPSVLPVGAGRMTNLTGLVQYDDKGNELLHTPNMLWHDPVSVSTFLDTEQSSYEHILAECNQLHYAVSGDSGISSESRMIAMAAYLIDLLQTAQQINAAWEWLLETALALAAVLSGSAGRYDVLRVSAECSVDPGPISPQMMDMTQKLTGGKSLLSVKTAQSWIGIEDSTAEAHQIATEEEKASAQQATLATAILDQQSAAFDRQGNSFQPQVAPQVTGAPAQVGQAQANGQGA